MGLSPKYKLILKINQLSKLMPSLQEVFIRIQESKKKKRDLNKSYKDALLNSQAYQDLVEEIKTLKEKKKSLEAEIKEEFASEITQMENLKLDIDTDNELISDLAINQLVSGVPVEVKDAHDQQYEPVFKVNFKKST